MTKFAARGWAAVLCVALLLAACGAPAQVSPSSSHGPMTPSASETASPDPAPIGEVVPAPGSASDLYAPNPGAITVAIDPGHGGCLDWGVPNPWDNTVANAEKTMVLGIAQALRDRLEAAGVRVVMTRQGDEALAGDDYPPQGCDGPPFRDVNGDGLAGFGPDLPEGTLARDELQARIDLANLARADVLLSIHINSFVEADGTPIEIAATQTFYTDETPWGPTAAAALADKVQAGAVDGLSAAPYTRQDRGTEAKNFYIVAPPLYEATADRPDPWKQPTRGALMPAVQSEVGSISLEEEAAYISSPQGREALAGGLFDGLAAWFAERPLAVHWQLAAAEAVPPAQEGDGPPFRAPDVAPDEPLPLSVTNSGTRPWPAGMQLVFGAERSDEPYLRRAPALEVGGVALPALAPGESVDVELALPDRATERTLVWVDLRHGTALLSDTGSPALQLAIGD
jgi:N-acetylmuramoyl-L-alanine amidase